MLKQGEKTDKQFALELRVARDQLSNDQRRGTPLFGGGEQHQLGVIAMIDVFVMPYPIEIGLPNALKPARVSDIAVSIGRAAIS